MKKRLYSILIIFFLVFFGSSSTVYAFTASPIANAPSNQRDRFQTDLFTGSAAYSYPISIPKGTDNLTPKVDLSYSSSGVRDLSLQTGAGWQIDRDYVQRDVNFTPTNTGDDKYKLHFQGQTYDLVYVAADSLFHTKIESHLKIQQFLTGGQNTSGIYWQVTTTDGTIYRFGYPTNAETVCNGQSYDSYWNVDQVTDIHNNHIYYTYSQNNGATYLSQIKYNNDLQREIDFIYSVNSYQRQTYQLGCSVTETNKLTNIQVKANSNLIHQYDLSYTSSANGQSLLQSITEKGSDGSALPPTTFDYKPQVKSWQRNGSWAINNGMDAYLSMTNAIVRVLDMNGDGFPDILKANNNGGYVSYYVFKNTGTTFENNNQTWMNNLFIDASPDQYWTRITDINGDGLPDIVKASYGTWSVYKNTGSSFSTSPEIWASNSTIPVFTSTNNHIGLVDVTGDGLPDVINTIVIGGPYTTIQVYRNTGSSFSTTPETWVNNADMDVRFDESNVALLDVNGDGLADWVKSLNNGGPNNDWRVYLNNGSSWNTTPVSWVNPIDVNNDMTNALATDASGDGLADIIKVQNNGGPNDDWQVWHGKGNSWNTPYDTWANPIDTNLNSPETTMADLNGDGLLDIVRSVHTGPFDNDWRFWQNQGKAPDLLSAIHTSKGGTISYDYSPSTQYQNTSLPFPLWVVSKMTVNNGLSNSQGTNDVTTYSYKNGFYKWQDREFRGFGEVDEVNPDGSKKQTLFNQDDATKGMISQTQTTDASGNLYAKTENTWTNALSNGVYTINLSSVKNYTYDGSSSNPKIVETDYQYDAYGNITKQSELGDTSTSGDERFTYNEYVSNASAWIVNALKHTYINAADDATKVAESWFYYDGSTNLNASPTKGDLTLETKWLQGGTSNPTTTYGYDTFGNQTMVVDANSHTTSATYDTTGTYPTSTTNAKNQTQNISYDLGTGNVLSKTDLNGNTTTYTYDVFGRVTKEIRPYDSSSYPTLSYQYQFDGTAPESVIFSKREVSSASGTLDTTTYVDGLGRKVQTRSDAEDTSQQIVVDTFYDPSGEVLKESVPHSDTLSSTYAAPVTGEKVTEYTYDPLNRVTIVRNPDTNIKTTAYDHWKVTTIDENGHIKRQYQNAYGKINKVEEVNGSNTYTTTYQYDSRDLLTKIIDNAGNNTTITYDSLGNKITQTDPDSGTWHYEYDGKGNVTKVTDNRGVVTTNTYDVLDRITKKDYPTDTDTTFAYDLGKIGTLSIATDSAGTVSYSYDNRLRKTQEQRSINGTTKTTQFSYDASDRMTTQTNPDGEVVTYAFNPQGEINSVTGTTGIVSNIDYNALGKITKKDFANGLSTNYTYNNTTDFRLNRIQTGTLQDLNYTYDSVGNIKTIADSISSKTQTFGYDDLDRLTTASESAGFNNQYQYNSIGNLTKYTSNGSSTDYTYGQSAGPHAVTIASASASQATSSATEILGTTWTLAGGNGSAEQNKSISSNTLAGATSIQVTFNLHGTSFGGADDEASVVFVQNGDWRAANLIANGAQNGLNGSQTVTIPVSSFHKVGDSSVVLDPNQTVTDLHARFWNSGTFSVDITSVKVVAITSGSGGPTNLALNKTVTTSSVENNDPTLVGSGAVDGNSSTRWSSNFSDPQWIYVDLGSTQSINHVKLTWDPAYGVAYQMQVSNDASNWTTIYSTTTGNGGVDDLTNLSGTGRYIRMYGTQRATQWGYSLYEFEVYGSSGGSTSTSNIASSGTGYKWWGLTSATSNSNKVAASGINDGNMTTDVRLDNGTDENANVWEAAGVTFTATQSAITAIEFTNGTWETSLDGSYIANFKLQFTTDGTTWTDSGWSVTPSYAYNASNQGQAFTFSGTSTSIKGARVIGQVHGTNPGASSWFVNAREVKVIQTTTTGGGSSSSVAAGPYTYDANGNMTSDGLHCYHYNDANKMDKVTNCNTTQTIAEYVYDYNGNRMVKKNYTNGTLANTVTSWSDSYETKVIVGGATENTSYYFANGQLLAKKNPDGSKYYIHSDHLGSTSIVTNQAGALVESTSYDPWGEVLSGGTKSKFLYTGQEKDSETSLNYYNARYYDSHIRRFTQPDNVVEDVYSPQSLNKYSYVMNNPIRYTDPTGHCIGFLTSFCGQIISVVTKVIQPVVNLVTKVINSPPTQQIIQNVAKVQSNPVVQKTENNITNSASKVANTTSKTTTNPVTQKTATNVQNMKQSGSITQTAQNWYKSTFESAEDSINYHVLKHGNGRTAEEYTDDALKFFNNNRDIMKDTILKDGTQGIKATVGNQGGYFTPEGKIVTYWD